MEERRQFARFALSKREQFLGFTAEPGESASTQFGDELAESRGARCHDLERQDHDTCTPKKGSALADLRIRNNSFRPVHNGRLRPQFDEPLSLLQPLQSVRPQWREPGQQGAVRTSNNWP